ncbi:14984_t:CDS:2, partial [Entrophospora sp. SA101]
TKQIKIFAGLLLLGSFIGVTVGSAVEVLSALCINVSIGNCRCIDVNSRFSGGLFFITVGFSAGSSVVFVFGSSTFGTSVGTSIGFSVGFSAGSSVGFVFGSSTFGTSVGTSI